MKVLIMGKRGGILRWHEHLLAAGAQLPQFDIQGFALNHNNAWERLRKKLFLGSNKRIRQQLYTAQNAARCIELYKPQRILIADLFYLSPEMKAVLTAFKPDVRIVQWIGDKFQGHLLENSQVVDHFYFTNSALVNEGQALGLPSASFMPLAYNPLIFSPGSRTPEKKDPRPLFIGAWSQNREDLFRAIRTPMMIYGKGWKPHLLLQHTCHDHNIALPLVARLYRQHLLTLNLINANNISSGLNMPCFEAPGSKTALLTDANPDLWHCYSREDVMAYENRDECNALLAEIPRRHEDLIRVSERGHEKALRHHQYQHRLKHMIECLDFK